MSAGIRSTQSAHDWIHSRGELFAGASSRLGKLVPKPITVTISHSLGRDEAKRRLDQGLGHIREQLAAFVSSIDYGWTGYRLDFGMLAMRQSITGRIEVEDRLVRVELGLPLLLHLLSRQIIGRIRGDGALLLDKPDGTTRA
ncbi:MAG TPA: polyhydroxyalkanoic acid system family protein [Stellaceae bacterium]|nr:polyhydroxyalkanoic acid system family protein [Stellaceae bacterium]